MNVVDMELLQSLQFLKKLLFNQLKTKSPHRTIKGGEEDMTQYITDELSLPEQDLLRFLIKDNAFNQEFLVTVLQEYYQNNIKSNEEKQGEETKRL